jgi:hypothetical protein
VEETPVPLNIKNEATHKAAKELARLRGTTLTKAVDDAIHEAIVRAMPPRGEDLAQIEAKIREIQERFASLPKLTNRTWQEIEDDMYDENGLPK